MKRIQQTGATTIAAVASLAASLCPAGAALLLDVQKWNNPSGIMIAFGVVLVLSVTCFLIAAFLSLCAHSLKSPQRDIASLEALGGPCAKQKEQPAEGKFAERIEDGLKASWQTARDKHHRTVCKSYGF